MTSILRTAKVSLDRISDFLHNVRLSYRLLVPCAHICFQTDMVDVASLGQLDSPHTQSSDAIGIREAVFTWGKPSTIANSSRRRFRLTIEDEVTFQRRKINLIVGQTGSGKTSLLMALLGEMHYEATGPSSFVRLPRAGGVAYQAQESWILNETIRVSVTSPTSYII